MEKKDSHRHFHQRRGGAGEDQQEEERDQGTEGKVKKSLTRYSDDYMGEGSCGGEMKKHALSSYVGK